MPSISLPRLSSRRNVRNIRTWAELSQWASAVDDDIGQILHSLKQVAEVSTRLTTGAGRTVLVTLVQAGPDAFANEAFFSWPHILSSGLQFFPSGVDIGRGADAVVTLVEGEFETAPSGSLGLQVLNDSGDGSPAGISVSSNRFTATLNKTIQGSLAKRMFFKMSTAPDGAEFLIWCRIRWHPVM